MGGGGGLDVNLAPDGDHKNSIKHVQSRIETRQKKIKCRHLPKENIQKYINTTIIISLAYLLLVLILMRKEYKKTLVPVLQIGLALSTFNHHFSQVPVYVSSSK